MTYRTIEIPCDLIKKLSYDISTGLLSWKETVSQRSVKGQIIDSVMGNGYVGLTYKRKKYKAHRVIWRMFHGYLPNFVRVDHINLNRSDNRIANLRLATHSQNRANTGKRIDTNSGFKGVSWRKREMAWVAQIQVDGKKQWLGLFSTAEEAHEVYKQAAVEWFGEFARAA